MKHNHLKWLILSQSSVFFAGSLIFPFYILFIKNIGSSYTQFGLSYGLFGLSGALIHPLLGRLSARLDSPLVPYGKFVGDGGASSDAPAHYQRAPGLCCAGASGPVRRDAKTRRENHDRRLHRRRGAGEKSRQLSFLDGCIFSCRHYSRRVSR